MRSLSNQLQSSKGGGSNDDVQSWMTPAFGKAPSQFGGADFSGGLLSRQGSINDNPPVGASSSISGSGLLQ